MTNGFTVELGSSIANRAVTKIVQLRLLTVVRVETG